MLCSLCCDLREKLSEDDFKMAVYWAKHLVTKYISYYNNLMKRVSR